MRDAQLLDALTSTDPCPNDAALPAAAWTPDDAWQHVGDIIDSGSTASPALRDPWRDRLIAAAVFAVVVLVGGALFFAAGPGSDEIVPTDSVPPTTTPPTTTVPPTSIATEIAQPIAPETLTLVNLLEQAFNQGDPEAASVLMTPDASITLAPWVSPQLSPSATSLVDRITTGKGFGEEVAIEECSTANGEIQCKVTFTDRFSEAVGLSPWVQIWTIEVTGGRIERLEVTADDPVRAAAMADFANWLESQATESPPVLVTDLEWQRSPEVAEVLDTYLVEYTLPDSITPDAWKLVSSFYESLSSGDIATTESLFVPGGQYLTPADSDEMSSALSSSTAVGSTDLRQLLTFRHAMLDMDLRPVSCTGDTTTITCDSESTGILVLFLPGGTATGTIEFTLGSDGIEVVENRIHTGATGDSEFDVRGFWRTWMPENAPDAETLWPGGNGNVEWFTVELARAIIQYYPPYLAERRIHVPQKYLDGTLLTNL